MTLRGSVHLAVRRELLNTKGVPDFEAVAPIGPGVFDPLKAVARLVLIELKRGQGG